MRQFILSMLVLLTTSPAFSYVVGKVPQLENRTTCPKEVNCTENDGHTVCQFTADDMKYWEPKIYYPNVKKNPTLGLYEFASAFGESHMRGAFGRGDGGTCSYTNPHEQYRLYIDAKPEANLEIDDKNNGYWSKSAFARGKTCTASLTNCQFKEKVGFVIHNVNLSDGIKMQLNKMDIGETIPANGYMYVTFDDVIDNCVSNKECEIKVLSVKNVKWGSVVADMDNKMKILRTTQMSPYVRINKVEGLNAVEVGYDERK